MSRDLRFRSITGPSITRYDSCMYLSFFVIDIELCQLDLYILIVDC